MRVVVNPDRNGKDRTWFELIGNAAALAILIVFFLSVAILIALFCAMWIVAIYDLLAENALLKELTLAGFVISYIATFCAAMATGITVIRRKGKD